MKVIGILYRQYYYAYEAKNAFCFRFKPFPFYSEFKINLSAGTTISSPF